MISRDSLVARPSEYIIAGLIGSIFLSKQTSEGNWPVQATALISLPVSFAFFKTFFEALHAAFHHIFGSCSQVEESKCRGYADRAVPSWWPSLSNIVALHEVVPMSNPIKCKFHLSIEVRSGILERRYICLQGS